MGGRTDAFCGLEAPHSAKIAPWAMDLVEISTIFPPWKHGQDRKISTLNRIAVKNMTTGFGSSKKLATVPLSDCKYACGDVLHHDGEVGCAWLSSSGSPRGDGGFCKPCCTQRRVWVFNVTLSLSRHGIE